MDEPKDHYRGTFLPVSLMRLYESETLNAEEVLLFAKIDALQDPKAGGCWASNQYLGKWWRKSDRWVSSTVTKFQQLKLVNVIQLGDGKRIIQMPGVRRNKTSTCSRNETSTKVPYGKEIGPRKAVRSLVDTFGIEGRPARQTEFSAGVRLYADFSKRRGFHVTRLNGEVRYAKGGQEGGWSRPVLEKWEKVWQDLCSRHGGEKAQKVLIWFLENYDLEFMPVAQTLPTFAAKWDQIEKGMRREQLKARHRNGDEEIADNEDQETAAAQSVEQMSPEDRRRHDEDMRKIQFPTGE